MLFRKLALPPQDTETSDAYTIFKMAWEQELLTILKKYNHKNITVLIFSVVFLFFPNK